MADLLDTSDHAARFQRGVELEGAFERLLQGYNTELEQSGVSTQVPGVSCPNALCLFNM